MNRRLALLGTLLLFVTALYTSAFRTPPPSDALMPNLAVQRLYHQDLNRFGDALATLEERLTALDDTPASVERARAAHRAARLRYKAVEYLMDYRAAEAVQKYLNGAPLPKIDPYAPSLKILEPEGMQVIDELLFDDEPHTHREELLALSAALRSHFAETRDFERVSKVFDRHFFEGVRFEIVRILSLGITGFDTPGSLHALPEALAAMRSMQTAYAYYVPYLEPALGDSIVGLFDGATGYLSRHQDFDTFDRLHFLKTYLNPLYKITLRAQLALEVETAYEAYQSQWKSPVNFLGGEIFSDEFLNGNYYASVTDTTPEMVHLGKLLFFDPVLSSNNERSCASCHQPDKGFTDGLPKSVATDFKGTVDRNAPTVLNAAYADRYFHDLRSEELEQQIEHVITDEREFHTTYFEISEKIARSAEYRALFREAFPRLGEEYISSYTLGAALGAYVRSLSSFNSPFDRYARGETDQIDPAVRRGFNLFMGKAACGTCHFAPTFNGTVPPFYKESESEVLGVPATAANDQLDPDIGRFGGRPKEIAPFYVHSFKTVTVRNVELTAPYMHNGVYATLEEVMDFYNRGGGAGMGLDVPHQTLAPDPLGLTDGEQQDIIAFMRALTDTTGLTGVPARLPAFDDPALARRVVGGKY
ncbi:MAG: cytochrome c peroxidase [Catalinimonas sp.]